MINSLKKTREFFTKNGAFFWSKLTPSEWEPVTVALTSSFVYVDFSAFYFLTTVVRPTQITPAYIHTFETWLNDRTPDSLVQLAHLVRADRNTRKGGKKKDGAIVLFENIKWCKPKQIVKEQQCTRDTELLAMGTILSAKGVFTQYCKNGVHPSLGQRRCNLQASPQCRGTAWDRPSSSLSPQNREPCFPVYRSPQLPLILELLHQGQ